MKQSEVAKLVAVLLAAYPASRTSPGTSEIYERMLADLDYQPANAAVERLIATARFMPTVAEIREATLAVTVGETKPGGDAWGEVRKLATFRDEGDVSGIDPLVLRVCRVMGWIKHRTLFRGSADVQQWHVETGDNESADRARFIELYDKYAAQERRSQASDALPAMKRWRELQARQEARLEQRTGEARGLGKLLALAIPSTEES